MLAMALEELPDAPLYYNLHDVAKSVKLSAPPADTFRSALVNAGALTLPLGFAQPSGMQAHLAQQRARRFISEWAARDGSACLACHAATGLVTLRVLGDLQPALSYRAPDRCLAASVKRPVRTARFACVSAGLQPRPRPKRRQSVNV